MAEYQRKLESAADALARKQLGIEPKKDGVEEQERLPEIYEKFKAEYLSVLEDSFTEVCAQMKMQLGVRHLSDDTLLIIAKKINDKAISGDLKFVSDLSQDKEIVAAVEDASRVQKQQTEATNAIEGDTVEGKDNTAEQIVAGVIAVGVMNDLYGKLEGASLDEAKGINEQIRVANYVDKTMDRFYDENGAMKKTMEGAGLVGLWQYVIKNGNEQDFAQLKETVKARLAGYSDEEYAELKQRCEEATTVEELDDLLGHAFYDFRERRNPNVNKRESYDELRKKVGNVGKNKSKEQVEQEREENLKLANMTEQEKEEYFRARDENIKTRQRIAREYKEALDQVLDGKCGYERLEQAVDAIRSFGDEKFYGNVLTKIRENAVKENDIGLGAIYKIFTEKDKQERGSKAVEAEDVTVDEPTVAEPAAPKMDLDEGPEL